MQDNRKPIFKAGWVLGIFSLIGIGMVSLTYQLTHEKIAENERLFILKNIQELVPAKLYDNDLLKGTDQAITVYKAQKKGQLVAVIFSPIAPDGYSGSIHLLVAINAKGELMGVRAVSHHETPGLGDAIETSKSDWIYNFNGRSLQNPITKLWQVKRDGGIFDQFTGATITPRAVVKSVFKTLTYFQANREKLATVQTKETHE